MILSVWTASHFSPFATISPAGKSIECRFMSLLSWPPFFFCAFVYSQWSTPVCFSIQNVLQACDLSTNQWPACSFRCTSCCFHLSLSISTFSSFLCARVSSFQQRVKKKQKKQNKNLEMWPVSVLLLLPIWTGLLFWCVDLVFQKPEPVKLLVLNPWMCNLWICPWVFSAAGHTHTHARNGRCRTCYADGGIVNTSTWKLTFPVQSKQMLLGDDLGEWPPRIDT